MFPRFQLLLCFFVALLVLSMVIFDDIEMTHNSKNLEKIQLLTTKSTKTFAFASFLSFNGFEGCWEANFYYESIAKLGVSWRKHAGLEQTNFDMILLVSHGLCHSRFWSFQTLEDIGWKIIHVNKPIYYEPREQERHWSWISGNRYEHTLQFTKLYMWTLIQYRRILYMDADMLIIGALPLHYLSYEAPSHVHSLGMENKNGAGLMLIHPSINEFRVLFSLKHSVKFDRELQEQTFLNVVYTEAHNRSIFSLDFVSGPVAASTLFSLNASWAGKRGWQNISVIHFCGENKPWKPKSCTKFKYSCDLWYAACNKAECLSF